MYTVSVRGHMMIAHSFQGELFGPAQRLHGATYVVDTEFGREELSAEGVVVDIGRAQSVLAEILHEFDFRNLDEDPAFAGQNTTTEFMARVIYDRLASRLAEGDLGPGSEGLQRIKVTLHESHIAWAAYEGRLSPA